MSVKLLSTTGLQTVYGNFTNNTNTSHLDRGLDEINNIYFRICNAGNWPFMERLITSLTTVASQQNYELPADCDQVKSVSVVVGTTRYSLEPIASWDDWERINTTQSWTSAFPEYYFVDTTNDQRSQDLYIWPVPSTTGNTIRVAYRRKPRRMTLADYTTGTVSAVTNGATTVTGSGTSWTSKMAGASIIIHDSFSANTGDGQVYEIASVASTTSLTLSRAYQGSTITAGSAAYTLGEVPLIPQEYAYILAYWAAYVYWASQDNGQQRAINYAQMFNESLKQMIDEQQNRSLDVDVSPVASGAIRNPNLFITI